MEREHPRFMMGPGLFSAPAGGGGPTDPFYANVSVLLHCDGANGGTTFTDNGPLALACTPTNVTTDTSQFKWGTASAHIASASPPTQDYLAAPDGTWFDFTTGDFTLECWLYMTTVQTCILMQHVQGTGAYPFQLFISSSNLGFRGFDSGMSLWSTVGGTGLSANTWYFIQARRSGNTFGTAINGVAESSVTTGSISLLSTAGQAVIIGNYSSGANFPVIGFLDDIRITKGVARAFTLPTAAFPNS